MTLLRRTAQLVEDLRTLNVIKKEDDVWFSQTLNGNISFRIVFNSLSHGTSLKEDSETIESAIKAEFTSELGIKIEKGVLLRNSIYFTAKSVPLLSN